MKLSKDTLATLSNFASINGNFHTDGGNNIRTTASANNIQALATIPDKFDSEAGIYDLDQFISAVNLLPDPEVELKENHALIKSGKSKIKFNFASKDILHVTDKTIKMPPVVVTINLSQEDISSLKKAASSFACDTISIKSSKEGIIASAINIQNTANTMFSITVDDTVPEDDFDFHISVENLKILPGDYTVSFAEHRITNWKNKNGNVEYYIATNETSTYAK